MENVVAIKKDDNRKISIHGKLLWRDNESFGIEFVVDVVDGDTATMTCYYDEWDLCYVEGFIF